MPAAIWYVRKISTAPVIDGIVSCIINADSADTAAQTLTAAHTKTILAGHGIPASGYFTNADQALASGFLDTDEDIVVFTERARTELFA